MKRRDFIKTLGAAGLVLPLANAPSPQVGQFDLPVAVDMEVEMETDLPTMLTLADGAIIDLQTVDGFSIDGNNNYRLDRSLVDPPTVRRQGRIDRTLSVYMTLPDETEYGAFISFLGRPDAQFTVLDGDMEMGKYQAIDYQGRLEPTRRDIRSELIPAADLFIQTHFTAEITMRRIYS